MHDTLYIWYILPKLLIIIYMLGLSAWAGLLHVIPPAWFSKLDPLSHAHAVQEGGGGATGKARERVRNLKIYIYKSR